jgi:hypothetical protein
MSHAALTGNVAAKLHHRDIVRVVKCRRLSPQQKMLPGSRLSRRTRNVPKCPILSYQKKRY